MFDFIFDAIDSLIELVGDLIVTIIEGIISFAQHVVGWFRGLRLRKNRDIPFIADASNPKFKEMLHQAPVKEVGIFEGVYNEETDEITNYQYIEAEDLDEKTSETLGNEPLVVLS